MNVLIKFYIFYASALKIEIMECWTVRYADRKGIVRNSSPLPPSPHSVLLVLLILLLLPPGYSPLACF
jgi:hypothetical protein